MLEFIKINNSGTELNAQSVHADDGQIVILPTQRCASHTSDWHIGLMRLQNILD